jgi:alpha-tubulin suppressor-like RCC1 family protein
MARLVALLALFSAGCGGVPTDPETSGAPALAVGGVFSCLVGPDRHLSCWGMNAWGQLGPATGERCGTEPCARRPVATAADLRFQSLSASPASSPWSGHVCGVTVEGDGFCWGVDKTQLGRELQSPEICVARNGLIGQPCSREPVRVELPGELAGTASGDFHSCGVDPGGAVWCWGSDSNGQLGSGDDEVCGEFNLPCSFRPVRITSDRRFLTVTAGSIHTCALDSGGEAWCWGNNDEGQLGHEAVLGRHVPAAAAGGLGFAQLAAGRRHTCGLVPGGEVYCWGDNAGGQLGGGSSERALGDVRVKTSVSFVAVSAGWWHTCALGRDGAAYCWGSNQFGQLGGEPSEAESCPAAAACSTTPVRVGGGRRFVAVGAGGAHSCGLVAEGAVYCWGDNSLGQLGDGGEAPSGTPVPVAVTPDRS